MRRTETLPGAEPLTGKQDNGQQDDQREVEGGTGRSRLPGEFESWFKDHRETVFRYVRFRVATRETAEDVTSEVFMKALQAFRRYNPDLAAPRTWLLSIARNAVTDHLRRLKRMGAMQVSLDRVPDMVSNLPSPEERMLKEERIQEMLNALRKLGNGAELLSLRYGSGLSNTEIAEQLRITPNAVAVRMHRALRRLKKILDEDVTQEKSGGGAGNGANC